MPSLPSLSAPVDPSADYELFTASDSTNFPGGASRAIILKTAGSVALVRLDNTVVITPPLLASVQYSLVAKRINATGSTNTGADEFFIMH